MNKKVILISGASTGIGFASAKRLIGEGHTVYCGARRVELMTELSDMGGKVISLDVTDDDSVVSFAKQAFDNEGRIDGVFANAGYCLLGPIELHSSADVIKQYDTNVVGTGRLLSATIPYLRKQRSGTILITSSVAGHVSMPNLGWYSSTKFAQQAIGDALRMELKEFGIKVSLIEPGYIDSDIDNASLHTLDTAESNPVSEDYLNQIKNFRNNWSKGIDAGASPDTIAKVVSAAFSATNPKRRYHPNPDARLALFMKKFFGHALLDKVLPGASIG